MWGTKKADELINFILPSRSYNTSELTNFDRIYTGWAKSQWAYVGLNSSVTECRIEISLSGMIFYHHWFEEFVKSKNIRVLFSNEGSYSHLLDSLDSRIEPNYI